MLVFFSSASVLVLEIMAGRLMAPFAGVTLESFTAIIGTVLAGIAVGSWLGGRAADAYPPERLVGPALVAGGLLALLSSPIIQWLGPPLRGGSPVNTVILAGVAFLLPALVLSAVTPVVIKLRLADLGETGTVVGRLSAFATAGAIAGTFVTGFVLVAAAPSQAVILVVAVLLLLMGAYAWFKYGRRSTRDSLLSIVAIAVIGSAIVAVTPTPCEVETAYFCARVEVDPERPSGRALWLDTLRHSYVDLEDPTYLEFRYARLVADVLAALPDGPLRNLYVGGGGFTFPAYISAVRPGSSHFVLELDPALVDLAERELGLVQSPDLVVVVGDARLGIHQAPLGSFDFVLGDAFGGPSVPWHLTTEEFLRDVADRLDDEGLYAMNLIDYPPYGFARAEAATIAAVFPHVLVMAPEPYLAGRDGGNFVLVGSKVPLDAAAVMANTAARASSELTLGGEAAAAWIDGADVLRDDFAPVDQLMSRP